MGRLIDADAWVQELRTQMSDKDCPGEIQDYCLFMINEINTRPTAYDVEEVVAELEKKKGTYFDGLTCEGTKIIINDAINIVKKGGIPAAEQEEGE